MFYPDSTSSGGGASPHAPRSQPQSARGGARPHRAGSAATAALPPPASAQPSRPGSSSYSGPAASFPDDGGAAAGAPGAARVLFSCCKGETHTHRTGFKQLFRRLRSGYRPEKLAAPEHLSPEVLLGGPSAGPAVLVLGCPTQPLSAQECGAIGSLLAAGGGLLVVLSEGGERGPPAGSNSSGGAGSNINYLLEQYGIAANPDAVLRTSFHKYMHPKEALVVDGVLNRALLGGGGGGGGKDDAGDASGGGGDDGDAGARGGYVRSASVGGGGLKPGGDAGGLQFVYPHGCTLTVQAPAVALLSSGRICYPMQRPLAAAWEGPPGPGGARGGRLLVFGSAQLFDDAWLDREANGRLMEWAFKWLRPVGGGAAPAGGVLRGAAAGRMRPLLVDTA
jgi:intraflagellar transport protein 52